MSRWWNICHSKKGRPRAAIPPNLIVIANTESDRAYGKKVGEGNAGFLTEPRDDAWGDTAMKSQKPTIETDPLKLMKEGVYQVIIGAIREEAHLACTKEQVVESLRQLVESGELVKVWINGKYQYFTPENAEQVVEDLRQLVESGEGSSVWVNGEYQYSAPKVH